MMMNYALCVPGDVQLIFIYIEREHPHAHPRLIRNEVSERVKKIKFLNPK
jgi:hypothetical protein